MERTAFLSYAREDKAWTIGLRAELGKRQVLSWFDESDIPVSVPWLQEVENGIAQSMIFVRVDSEKWRQSDPCSTELATAKQAGVRIVEVQVGRNVTASADSVVRALDKLQPWEVERISLVRRSSAWKAGGQKSGALARGRALQRTRRAMRGHLDKVDETSKRYLRESVRRRHRVRFLAVISTVLAIALIGIPAFAQLLEKAANVRLDQVVAHFADQAEQQEQIDYDPYLGLSAVSTNRSSGYLADSARVDALAAVLPYSVEKATSRYSWSTSRTATSHDRTMVAAADPATSRIRVRNGQGDVIATLHSSGP